MKHVPSARPQGDHIGESVAPWHAPTTRARAPGPPGFRLGRAVNPDTPMMAHPVTGPLAIPDEDGQERT